MKTGVNLSKIVSTSIALIVCFAVLAFALTALSWGAALPAHAAAGASAITAVLMGHKCLHYPASGPAGTSVTVSSGNIPIASDAVLV